MRDPRIKMERIENCFEGKVRYVRDSVFDYEDKGRYIPLKDL